MMETPSPSTPSSTSALGLPDFESDPSACIFTPAPIIPHPWTDEKIAQYVQERNIFFTENDPYCLKIRIAGADEVTTAKIVIAAAKLQQADLDQQRVQKADEKQAREQAYKRADALRPKEETLRLELDALQAIIDDAKKITFPEIVEKLKDNTTPGLEETFNCGTRHVSHCLLPQLLEDKRVKKVEVWIPIQYRGRRGRRPEFKRFPKIEWRSNAYVE